MRCDGGYLQPSPCVFLALYVFEIQFIGRLGAPYCIEVGLKNGQVGPAVQKFDDLRECELKPNPIVNKRVAMGCCEPQAPLEYNGLNLETGSEEREEKPLNPYIPSSIPKFRNP